MNIETKIVKKDASEYLNFGWKQNEVTRVRSGRAHHFEYVLARDKDMPHYDELVSLERKYFGLKAQKRTYEPIDGLICLLAFLCLIFPGIIYVAYKCSQKNEIETNNANVQSQMNDVLAKARTLR